MASRQFSLPTVLRMVPNTLLKACFEELGHGQFDPNWAELKKKEIDPILDYLEELPVEQLNEIEGVLRNVFDLGCPSGYDALVEAAPNCGVPNLSSVVPDELCVYGRAMWTWLHQTRQPRRFRFVTLGRKFLRGSRQREHRRDRDGAGWHHQPG